MIQECRMKTMTHYCILLPLIDDAWNEVFTFFNTSKEEFALSPNLHLVFVRINLSCYGGFICSRFDVSDKL